MCSRSSTTPTSRDPSKLTAPSARNRWICLYEARSGRSAFLGGALDSLWCGCEVSV